MYTYLKSHLAMLSVLRNIIPLPSANASVNSVVKPRKIIIWRSCGRYNNGTTAIEPHWSVSNNVCRSVGLGIGTWGARPGCLFLLPSILTNLGLMILYGPLVNAVLRSDPWLRLGVDERNCSVTDPHPRERRPFFRQTHTTCPLEVGGRIWLA